MFKLEARPQASNFWSYASPVLALLVTGTDFTIIALIAVFLLIGMLAGEEGPGGIVFSDYKTTYLVGSVALAIILFDGGLRTRFATFRSALSPSLVLASSASTRSPAPRLATSPARSPPTPPRPSIGSATRAASGT